MTTSTARSDRVKTREAASPRSSRWTRIRHHPLFHLALAILVVGLVQGFLVKPYQVPSASMEPTLHVDGGNSDRFLVNRLADVGGEPEIGDVVVFARPDSWGPQPERSALRTAAGFVGDLVGFGPSNVDALVKRVMGTGDDTVECCSEAGKLLIDGAAVEEPYVVSDAPFTRGELDCTSVPISTRCFPEVEVPDGQVLVMGDNRGNSSDSAISCRGSTTPSSCARFVPLEDVVGEAVQVILPLSRWGQSLSADVETVG